MVTVYVPGVFDVLHVGHLNYLRAVRGAGDRMIVGVQDDREVLQQKGLQPVVPLAERMALIEALGFVDEVVSYRNVNQSALLKGLDIDVFAVGEEYGRRDLQQRQTLDYCDRAGVRVFRVPRTPHVSSTQIRARLKEFWSARARLAEQLPAGVTVLGSFGGDQQKARAETEREVQQVLAAVDDPANKSLLDLACGDGRLLAPLAGHFARATGVDFSPELLEIARRRLAEAGNEAQLVESDVTCFMSDEQYDVLLLSGLIPYLDDPAAESLVARLVDRAKPAATLLVRNTVGLVQRTDVVNQYSEALAARYTAYYRTPAQIEGLFSARGWQVTSARQLYQHSAETAMWWFEMRPAGAAQSGRLGESRDVLPWPRPPATSDIERAA